MSLIEIEHLTYSYPGAENPTLNDISIQIKKGNFLASLATTDVESPLFVKH